MHVRWYNGTLHLRPVIHPGRRGVARVADLQTPKSDDRRGAPNEASLWFYPSLGWTEEMIPHRTLCARCTPKKAKHHKTPCAHVFAWIRDLGFLWQAWTRLLDDIKLYAMYTCLFRYSHFVYPLYIDNDVWSCCGSNLLAPDCHVFTCVCQSKHQTLKEHGQQSHGINSAREIGWSNLVLWLVPQSSQPAFPSTIYGTLRGLNCIFRQLHQDFDDLFHADTIGNGSC